MLDRVGDRLADDEVRDGRHGLLGLLGQRVLHSHRYRRPLGDRFQGRAQPRLVQRGRVDPPGHLAQLVQGPAALVVGLAQQAVAAVGVLAAAGPAEQHAEGDEALLHSVVQVALDAAPFVVHRVDDRGAAGGQLGDPPLQLLLVARAEEVPGQLPLQSHHTEYSLHGEEHEEEAAQTAQDQRTGVAYAVQQEPAVHPEGAVRQTDGGRQHHDPAQDAQGPVAGDVPQRPHVLVRGCDAEVEPHPQPAPLQLRQDPRAARTGRSTARRPFGQAATGSRATPASRAKSSSTAAAAVPRMRPAPHRTTRRAMTRMIVRLVGRGGRAHCGKPQFPPAVHRNRSCGLPQGPFSRDFLAWSS